MNRTTTTRTQPAPARKRSTSAALWLPGLVVALGAAIATAHGLYEVAAAAGVPDVLAWLYPLITDGLALVAYACAPQLAPAGRRYATGVVVLAAGLSGLAQASYLAGWFDNATAVLRFGVGAWPAIAAAIVAHLLFMLGAARTGRHTTEPSVPISASAEVFTGPAVQPSTAGVQPTLTGGVHPTPHAPASNGDTTEPDQRSTQAGSPGVQRSVPRGEAPQLERARAATRRHAVHHGTLPTVTQLMEISGVARGTAGNALKTLRDQPTPLHVVHNDQQDRHDKAQP